MIEISWPLLITQIVTFLAAMVVVWKLSWGPLTRLMRERARKIAGDIEQAEKGRKQIEALEADYHQRLSQIEEQARKQINEAIAKGNQAKEEILRTARREAQDILEKSHRDLLLERERVVRELRLQVADISMDALERLLGQGVDAKIQRKLLDEFLQEVEGSKKVK